MSKNIKMRAGINQQLFEWITRSQFGKSFQKEILTPGFKNSIKSFLAATTDAKRLVDAERVALHLLKMNDLADMLELRKEVRTLELTRKINYSKQTDHSAHSVYLYVLGLYFLDNSTHIQNEISSHYPDKGQGNFERFKDFSFPWVFNSLIHDIGYIFSEPLSVTPSSRKILNRMYQARSLQALMRPTNLSHDDDFSKFMGFIRKTISHSRFKHPEYSNNLYPDDTLNVLRQVPWCIDLDLPTDCFEIFAQYGKVKASNVFDLEKYAYYVAEKGYEGKGDGTVDHGIASALFLLQWSTYYYWLAAKTESENLSWFNKFFSREEQDTTIEPYEFSFENENLKNDIIPATCAVAFHNIIKQKAPVGSLLPFELNQSPLTYISVLCDELQKWDRYPAGHENLTDLESFAEISLTAEDIFLNIEHGIIEFKVSGKAEAVNKLQEVLNSRLKDWDKIVRIVA